jgi:hypothetical protein
MEYPLVSLPDRGDLEGQKTNPAKDYFIVRYELDNDYADAIIQLTDITGKTVKQYKTGMTMDYLIIQTGNLKKGNYFVKLILNGNEIGVQKVLIQ